MREYTLQEVIEKCDRDGGTFTSGTAAHVWRINKAGKVVDQNNIAFILFKKDLNAKWQYTPARTSAFQEWERKKGSTYCFPDDQETETELRKEGWNAAIDEVLRPRKLMVRRWVSSSRGTPERYTDFFKHIENLREA